MLPDWLDVDMLRFLALVSVGLLVLLAVFSGWVLKKTMFRALSLLVCVGLGFGVWWYRDRLDECRVTCSCSFLGYDVPVADCPASA